MLKYFLKLRRKKGFTLVELIVVVALLAIMMASIAALSGPIRKMVNRTAASADSVAANATIANYIENRLAFAANIEFVMAYNADDGSGTVVNSLFNGYQSYLSGTKDKAGILIFHYEEDTNYPEESHYRLYDVPIKAGDTYNSAAIDSGTMNEENAVFADCFYDFSSNLMIAPTSVTKNQMRDNYYLTIDIIPYDFKPDSLIYNASGDLDPAVKQTIASSTIPEYYEYSYKREAEIASGADPATFLYTDETCGLGVLDKHRSGTKETATFELQNILTATTADPNPTIDARCKFQNCAATGATGAGTDILIFYYIPNY